MVKVKQKEKKPPSRRMPNSESYQILQKINQDIEKFVYRTLPPDEKKSHLIKKAEKLGMIKVPSKIVRKAERSVKTKKSRIAEVIAAEKELKEIS